MAFDLPQRRVEQFAPFLLAPEADWWRRNDRRTIRGVVDFSGSYLSGDQGQAIGTDWLARFGVGGEVDFSETWVPRVSTARLLVRVTRGENLEGISVGLGISF